jgi:predicted NBD/HSP70 family sugar kinase
MEDQNPDHQLNRPGPKTIVYKFNENKNLVLGLEITPNSINGTLIDLGKKILFKKSYPIEENLDNVNLYRHVRNTFYGIIEDSGKPEESITTLVFALTGALDRDKLIWTTSPKIHSVKSVDFHFFEESLPHVKRVFIEHDITARANSIIRTDNAHPHNFAFLHISDGVGMTVMNDGAYIRGHRGLAGELGHIPMLGYNKIEGIPCYCGKTHCLESFLSSKALLHHIKNTYGVTLAAINEAPEILNKHQIDEIFQLVQELMLNITTTIVNLFDPQVIYIGGCVAETWYTFIEESFIDLIKKQSWQGGPERIQFYHEESTNPSYGAAISVIPTTVKKILLEVLT